MNKGWGIFVLGALMLFSCNKSEEIEGDRFVAIGFKVLEYRPAPGQFINENMNSTTQEEANAYAERRIENGEYVSLGSFGGYITVKMAKAVENKPGNYDFGIIGNAFYNSSEPGIVWVSEDVNGNCIADDPWYELKGSDAVTKNYSVTYTRPTQPGDIVWEDNLGNNGIISYQPTYHAQMYYPEWIKADSYTLTGSMLPPRTEQNEDGFWENKEFDWGYADNMGNDAETGTNGIRYNKFEIDNAVDAENNPVTLKKIHFVKVQSAILKDVEGIGEVSTEVAGFIIF